jgi:acyl transferase domain-containing protein/NAD(P)-dependent dehydrogenase (short-subunit alcohol dehydrogenase family)
MEAHCAAAQRLRPLAEAAPLAASHGTRYPIVQGPMTRVSDRAEFGAAVSEAGALPFLALALMRAPEVDALLAETQQRLGDRPWGVGILGFVPPDLRSEQLEVIRRYRPPYALIAGGRPEQARSLEADGIPTYLHVPSPGLLGMFLQEGARRFVFEGRECGGHVGPRASFVLWDSMVDVLLDHLDRTKGAAAADLHVLFAGGIHDASSAAMVSALAGSLIERGVRIGVLMGTAYLYTEEAVRTGAIVEGFQAAALACTTTVLLDSGPGQTTRCAPSPFAAAFEAEKSRLIQSGLTGEPLKNALEELNVGRLRIAAKGVDRHPRFGVEPDVPKLVELTEEAQRERGMYMIGQVAALRESICTLAALHEDVSAAGTALLETLPASAPDPEVAPPPAAVAIVGMGCILPGASDLRAFWANVLNKVDAVVEVPEGRWDWRRHYDPDPKVKDKVYSKWGGFVDPIPFDPVLFGMPPGTLSSIEPFQLLTLAVVRAAFQDAGLLDRPFPRERTSVILGAGGGAGDLTIGYMVRSSLPALFGESAPAIIEQLDGALPEWTEDSFAGLLMNVAAGRVANRFDLGGVNYTVDAACASSLAAVYAGVRELEARTSDVVVVGGVDAVQNPFAFLCFSKTHAHSPTGRCRTFDAEGDGIAIGEGFAALVLKRLDDAERDGDRIYGVIRAVGGSSDGRDRGLTAPRPEGQIRALRRAYAQAGFSPATLDLIEAHGTGTVVGDQTEVQSLTAFLNEAGAARQRTAIGSVKSMIGHTKATAGVAGLIKVALALHHRVLPATLGVTQPNAKANFPESPLYVNAETRPWVRGAAPRRAGVSAFGFGGTNFHVVVEEYTGAFLPRDEAPLDPWPAELFVWRAGTRDALRDAVTQLAAQLERGARPPLADLAFTLAQHADAAAGRASDGATGATLALVAASLDDLRAKLASAQALLEPSPPDAAAQPAAPGVYFTDSPLAREGQVAFLFPGQGSQYVNMLRELSVVFPEVREAFDRADQALPALDDRLSRFVFPPPVFTKEDAQKQQSALTETNVAQPALAAAEVALLGLLRRCGVEPRVVAGHSFGEFVALHAAGCIDEATLLRLAEARGRFMREGAAGTGESGTMAAVDADAERLRALLAGSDVTLANLNAPRQTVISGARAQVEAAVVTLEAQGIRARRLPVACAFHSPLVAPARDRLEALLREVSIRPPALPVFSNTTAARYPDDAGAIVDTLSAHLVRPVEFVRQVQAMHAAGARLFVECGPRSVLSGLVDQILEHEPHRCVAFDQPARPGLAPLLHGLAALAAEGVPVLAAALFRGRSVRRLDLGQLDQASPQYSPTTWLVDGGRAWPAHQPERRPPAPLRVTLLGDPSPAAASGPAALPHYIPPAKESPTMAAEARSAAAEEPPVQQVERLVSVGEGHSGDVMGQFQHVMQHFLDTQRSVMLAYLGADGRAPRSAMGAGTNGARRPQLIEAPVAARPVLAPPPASPTTAPPPPVSMAPPAPPVPTAPPPSVSANPISPVPSTSAPAAPAATPLPSMEQLTARLLAVVGERTGYPTEMLALDADLEADLSIDSIKRVEIVGTFVRALQLPPGLQPDMEQLTTSRSLRQLLDSLAAALGGAPPPDSTAAPPPLETPALAAAGANGHAVANGKGELRPFEFAAVEPIVERFAISPAAASPITRSAPLARSGAVVITDDGTGIAARLAERLEQLEYRTVRIAPTDELGTAEAVERLVSELHRSSGPVSALVHLAPLRPGAEGIGLDLARWRERLDQDLKGLFLLAQALRPDLEASAAEGGAAVLGVTALGGAFASDRPAHPFFPGHGGLTGFLKALAVEWPDVRVRAVDLEPAPAESAAQAILDELLAADELVEVGYRAGQRTRLELVRAPLAPLSVASPLPLDDTSVVLITGGARGITADAALEVARASRCTLVLTGRTAAPEAAEPAETATLDDPAALKRRLMERQRQAGQSPTPATVEAAYRRLTGEREVRATLERLRAAGARVEYVACDVRDAGAFGALIEDVYRRHQRIDGVIHGAGIIEDKLVRDKTLDSFSRVLSTKVESALTLVSHLRPESLRFLLFYSSIAGRLGNRGQADYGATNEILNKLAVWLQREWKACTGRVVAVAWGPWATHGMASPEVQRQFVERGVALVPPEVGNAALLAELSATARTENEVVVAGGSAIAAPPTRPSARPVTGPSEVRRTLSLTHDRYLDDHRLRQAGNRPVLPLAMALEYLAQAAAGPDHVVVGARDVRLLRRVLLQRDELSLRIAVSAARDRAVVAELYAPEDARIPNYRATIDLAAGVDISPAAALTPPAGAPALSEARAFPLEIGAAYRQWLFHGPRWQVIESLPFISAAGLTASVRPSRVEDLLALPPDSAAAGAPWIFDPAVVDAAAQLAILWCRWRWDMTCLPVRIDRLRRLATPAPGPVRCELRVRAESAAPTAVMDYWFYDAAGTLVAIIEGFEHAASAALNALTGPVDATVVTR